MLLFSASSPSLCSRPPAAAAAPPVTVARGPGEQNHPSPKGGDSEKGGIRGKSDSKVTSKSCLDDLMLESPFWIPLWGTGTESAVKEHYFCGTPERWFLKPRTSSQNGRMCVETSVTLIRSSMRALFKTGGGFCWLRCCCLELLDRELFVYMHKLVWPCRQDFTHSVQAIPSRTTTRCFRHGLCCKVFSLAMFYPPLK